MTMASIIIVSHNYNYHPNTVAIKLNFNNSPIIKIIVIVNFVPLEAAVITMNN